MGKPQTHTHTYIHSRANLLTVLTPANLPRPPALEGRKLIESAVVICRCGGPKIYENEMPRSAFPLFRFSAFGTCVCVCGNLYVYISVWMFVCAVRLRQCQINETHAESRNLSFRQIFELFKRKS